MQPRYLKPRSRNTRLGVIEYALARVQRGLRETRGKRKKSGPCKKKDAAVRGGSKSGAMHGATLAGKHIGQYRAVDRSDGTAYIREKLRNGTSHGKSTEVRRTGCVRSRFFHSGHHQHTFPFFFHSPSICFFSFSL